MNENDKQAEPVQPALAHVNETPKNEHDSDDVLKLAANPEVPEPGFHGCTFSAGSKLVRLTDDDVMDAYSESSLDVNARLEDLFDFANVLQDAWIKKNGG